MKLHPVHLHLSDSQIASLLQQHEKIRAQFEGRYFLNGETLPPLAAELRDILLADSKFSRLYHEADPKHIAVQLIHPDNRILNLPWREAIKDKQRLYLMVNVQKTKSEAVFVPTNPLPLKILIMVASPEDLEKEGRLNYEQEEKLIIQAFEPLLKEGKVEIDFTNDGSLERLEDKLKENHYHILHFSGHGVYDKEGRKGEKVPNTGYLLLEDEDTLKKKLVSAQTFAHAINIREENRPYLVLLSSCQTGQGQTVTAEEGGFRGVANKLLDVGIPAVVSMGFSVLDGFATDFAAELYRQLATQEKLIPSFQYALAYMRAEEWRFTGHTDLLDSQWLIPQLSLNQDVQDLIDWKAPFQALRFASFKLATGEQRLLLKERKGYLFIGRRRERRDAQAYLQSEQQGVMLRGMGGIGKTALAEHLLARMIAKDPKVQPFIINEEEQKTLDALMTQMKDYLEKYHDRFNIYSEAARHTKAIDQFNFLLGEVSKVCHPVFLMDNMEFFQEGPEGPIKPTHEDIQLLLARLWKLQRFPLILTGRYPLQEVPDIPTVDLNSVKYADFYKKCLQLRIAELTREPQKLPKKAGISSLTFDHLVALLHETLGGNYRALEFFDELYSEKKAEIQPTLEKLEDFRKKFQGEMRGQVEARLQSGARDLVFRALLDILTPEEVHVLQLLKGFRIPVLPLALEMQGVHQHLETTLQRLHHLTLIERQQQAGESQVYFYMPPLTRNYLAAVGVKARLDHAQAGAYHELDEEEVK
ncbi:MAG: CHAT domain-containing protein, partial [Bacteroidota bacterium]